MHSILLDNVRVTTPSSKEGKRKQVEALTDQISIAPNPAKTQVVITAAETIENITIYTATGSLMENRVRQRVMANNKVSLNVSGLENGIYFLKISTRGKTIIKQFIKQ